MDQTELSKYVYMHICVCVYVLYANGTESTFDILFKILKLIRNNEL